MSNQNTTDKIKSELENLRAHLQMDGGDVQFIDFDEKTGVLRISLQGACIGCSMRQITLDQGIGRVLKEKIPEVKEVIEV